MKHLKIIKEDTVETFVTSNSAGIPCVCCYDQTHENYDSNEPVVIVTERPSPSRAFTINGVTYYAEDNMTWEQWVNSKYNTGGFVSVMCSNSYCSHTFIKLGSQYVVDYNVEGMHGEYIVLSRYDEENRFRLSSIPAPCINNAPTSKPILQFTIYGYQASYPGIILAPVGPDCQTLTFDYEEGMTWIDWCNSSYNTMNWTINDGRVLHHLDYAVYDGFNGTSIKGTDTIDSDKCYSYAI